MKNGSQLNWDYQNGNTKDKSREGSGDGAAAAGNPGWCLFIGCRKPTAKTLKSHLECQRLMKDERSNPEIPLEDQDCEAILQKRRKAKCDYLIRNKLFV